MVIEYYCKKMLNPEKDIIISKAAQAFKPS